MSDASATWRTTDHAAAERRLRALGQLQPDEEPEINITLSRELLVREQAELPPRAVVLEAAADGDLENVSIATLRLAGERLTIEAVSERRLW